ncbi:MAG: DUF3071 domain-containing protein [Bifidobacteriaceae bacterium]|jgi:hypothetical protein|nr:DUF3071 domain-containing protein [Bifidobacteriaceae bacterium]
MELQKLHFKGVDEANLLLQDDDEVTYAVKVDAELRFAVLSLRDKETQKKGKLSLQNVQKFLRQGLSVSELVKLTGIEATRIEKYNIPIIREKQYAISEFQKVDVRVKNGVTQIKKLLSDVFEKRDYEQLEWVATRNDTNPWEIILTYAPRSHGNTKRSKIDTRSAVWSWNPRTNLVRTLNKDAEDLFQEIKDAQEALNEDARSEFFEKFTEPAVEQPESVQDSDHEDKFTLSNSVKDYPSLFASNTESEPPIPSFPRKGQSANQSELLNFPDSFPKLDDESQTPQHNIVRVESEDSPSNIVTSPMIRVAQTSSFQAEDVEKKVESKKPKRPQLPEWDEILFGPTQK